jgi:hypothetical protein
MYGQLAVRRVWWGKEDTLFVYVKCFVLVFTFQKTVKTLFLAKARSNYTTNI